MNLPGGSYGAGISLANDFFDQIYGVGGVDYGALFNNYVGLASGAVFGGNPPYTISNFLAIYPKFFGPAASFTGNTVAPVKTRTAIAQGQENVTVDDATFNQITNVSSMDGMAVGQLVNGPGIAGGSVISALGTATITLSRPVCATQTGASFNFYAAPFVPLLVLQIYINLALGSIMQARWQDTWYLAMALYVAHYTTLWMETETGPNSTAAQVATSGLQQGIIVSQAAGDVSAGTQPVPGFDDWGSLNLTQYGIQLATFAKTVGSGPIWVGSAVASRVGYI